MKKAKDIHRLLESVELTVNTDTDKDVLERVLRASRESASPVSEGNTQKKPVEPGLGWRVTIWRIAGCVAAALLIVSSWMTIDSRRAVSALKAELEFARKEVALAQHDIALAQQKTATAPPDNSATINLYLREHRDVVARHVSMSPAPPQPAQMRVNQQDILYYEYFDDGPELIRPGIIVRGPSSKREIGSPGTPVISNGHTLTLPEAQETADFELQAPARLHPGYELDQIRRIDGRDTLQLLYTDGINSVSLFEQSLDGQRGLSRQDFREYVVYRNKKRSGGTILAWRDDELSYVLIGNTEMSQLMDMAQSISTGK
ncbi:hypothetical protein ACFL6U_32050 [Planctomycetota bacterium]